MPPSKRRGAASVLFFRELGYLPEALTNYMALLGWYPRDGVEFLPDGELAKRFDVEHCSKSPSMFDFFLIGKPGKGGYPAPKALKHLVSSIVNTDEPDHRRLRSW